MYSAYRNTRSLGGRVARREKKLISSRDAKKVFRVPTGRGVAVSGPPRGLRDFASRDAKKSFRVPQNHVKSMKIIDFT